MRIFGGRRSASGQGLAEYGIIVALIAVAAIVALLFISGAITGLISSVGRAL